MVGQAEQLAHVPQAFAVEPPTWGWPLVQWGCQEELFLLVVKLVNDRPLHPDLWHHLWWIQHQPLCVGDFHSRGDFALQKKVL